MAPESHTLAISRFSQANNGLGSGLGLPIAARVAEIHKGHLTIYTSDVGASVSLYFPCHHEQ